MVDICSRSPVDSGEASGARLVPVSRFTGKRSSLKFTSAMLTYFWWIATQINGGACRRPSISRHHIGECDATQKAARNSAGFCAAGYELDR
jgi:hypothetical protein